MRRQFSRSIDPSNLEGFPERQAEREKKRRGHVVRQRANTREQRLGDTLPISSEPVRRDVLYEMAWMNRGSRF